ncbi:hypothetical protein [Lyngbya aestuarii]|uniref:hypothetical protein n=1 Tax=Lyngbya aestuarii TaxID=118322 RepID=UPI00403D637F
MGNTVQHKQVSSGEVPAEAAFFHYSPDLFCMINTDGTFELVKADRKNLWLEAGGQY